jgi:UPF0755 protein
MKKRYILITSLILILGIFSFSFIPKSLSSVEESSFNIKGGTGLKEIASELEKEGYISNDFLFVLYSFLTGNSKSIQSGHYKISPNMSIAKISKKFSTGDISREKLTIIEGWTIKDIIEYLENKDIFKEDIENVLNSDGKLFNYDFLKDNLTSLEGYIFPDTYYVGQGEDLYDFLDLVFKNFKKKVDSELLTEIERQGKTLHEIIIMASLIEREVKSYEDKRLVSGVLWNREAIGMALQSCSTVTYLTGKDNVPLEDTKIDSPYNTYLYPGLPIGPISNPGLDSIKAAIYPQESNYFYFLSTPTGETIFSRNLTEHNIAKARYLK